MPISAINFQNNSIKHNSTQNKAEISFAQRNETAEKKNHKKLYITAGALVGLAALAFAFRKKISNIPFVKKSVVNVENVFESLTKKSKKVFKKSKKAVTKTFDNISEKISKFSSKAKNVLKKTSKFSKEENKIIKKYIKTGANQQGVFDTLKKHGMTNTEEKYVKETITFLKERFARNNSATKPISMRFFMNSSLKKGNPQEVISSLIENSKNLRKKWS